MRMRKPALFISLIWFLVASASARQVPEPATPARQVPEPATPEVLHRVFLLGDTGGFNPNVSEPVLDALREQLLANRGRATVVFLGDNVYPRGLPDSLGEGRAMAEMRLIQQLDAVKETGARIIVIPGNHDWDESGPDGLAAIQRQESFVEDYLGMGNTFLPDDGLPGPVTVKLADGVQLVVLDTEWWLRTGEKGFGDAGRYETREEGDLLANMADVLRRKDDDHLLVVGHHPFRSNGRHGGHFPLKEHIFPLTALWDWAYVPLPLVGSLYPLAVAWIGGSQDLAHWKYRSLSESLGAMFALFPNSLIYAAGHEHSLQHFREGNVNYLVSGSASRASYVAEGSGAAFVSSEPGFLEVVYLSDGSAELTAHSADGTLYQAELHPPAGSGSDLPPPETGDLRIDSDSTVLAAAGPELAAGRLKRALLGTAHREAWTTPISVPVLDVGAVEGGLKPVQRGGGQQTISLRMESATGAQFVLRSLTKDPTKTLPVEIQETFARDIVLDQVSVLHPYGALLVPPLAAAIGTYYATPRLYYVPRDARMAPYEEVAAERVMLFEERPSGDMSNAPQFGRSPKVIGASKMYHEITGDNDHRVDQRFFARNRILDMLISDWDRHEDQWRWATFEPPDKQGKIYRAIPRDRDWAFNRMNGFFPTILQSQLVLPKFQEFKSRFGFIPGLNFNGMPQDRRLTSALTPEDWLAISDSVAAEITPGVVREALSRWPDPIRELQGEEFEGIFKSRLEGLHDAVSTYTEFLDRYVDIVMSDKHEEFVVREAEGGRTEVVVYKTSRKGDRRKELYRRTFDPERTREIRLYGMGGVDRFDVGSPGPSIRIEVIGGTGQDVFEGSPDTPRAVSIYDTRSGIALSNPGRARIRTSDDPRVNGYDRFEYRFNVVLPAFLFGANEDDGLFLGGGASFYRHAFRKLPFASRQRIRANSAVRFGAFNVRYDAQFIELIRGLDLTLDAAILSPDNIQNFFGLGNDTPNTEDSRRFYQARFSEYRFLVGLRKRLARRSHASLATFVNLRDVRPDTDRFVTQSGIAPESFSDQQHLGFKGDFVFDARDSVVLPGRGMRWATSFTGYLGINAASENYARLTSSASFFLSGRPDAPNTLAIRVGVQHVLGQFPFFAAATLGGSRNLRGWRSTRFAGRTAVYQNIELRRRISRFAGFLANGQLGVLGFVDQGRVWTDGEDSSTWHRGAGGGLWISLFDSLVLTGSVGFSSEQEHYVVSMGFLY
jgi:DNA repair exonuclease SbcCD nuclease subunit